MKLLNNRLLMLLVFCFIQHTAYSSQPLTLDAASEALLLAKLKTENIATQYWSTDVDVQLDRFYKMSDNNDSPTRYYVRAVGFRKSPYVSEVAGNALVGYGRSVERHFSEKELLALGVNLPE